MKVYWPGTGAGDRTAGRLTCGFLLERQQVIGLDTVAADVALRVEPGASADFERFAADDAFVLQGGADIFTFDGLVRRGGPVRGDGCGTGHERDILPNVDMSGPTIDHQDLRCVIHRHSFNF